MNDLGKFVNSPFHNESTKMIKLYGFLKKYHPDFENKKFTKENIFKAIYDDKKEAFDDKKIRDRFSDMLKLTEEYLAYIDLRQNALEFKRYTLHQLGERGLNVHFEKKDKEIQAIVDKIPYKNEAYFEDVFKTFSDRVNYYSHQQFLGKKKPYFTQVEKEFDHFLNFSLTKILRYYAFMQNMEGLINYKFKYKFHEPVMKFIEENNLEDITLIKVFCLIQKLKNHKPDIEPDENAYYELKEMFTKNADSFSQYDKIMISTELYNRATKGHFHERDKFTNEAFEIIKLQLKYESYPMENGWMQREFFFISVNVSISANDLKWTEKFIENYTLKVFPEHRVDAVLVGKALLCFAQKKYEDTLMHLSKTKNADYIYYALTKTLLCKAYYELNEKEKVLSTLDSFRHYLATNAFIPPPIKVNYSHFVETLNRITLLNFNKDEFRLAKVIEELKNQITGIHTPNKIWLLEKAIELKKEFKKEIK